MAYNLKSEEDVKEYLKNLYIEYKFGCLSEKRPEVCHLLGDYEESIKKDIKKAAEIYKTNCDVRSYPRSCAKYGGFALVGKGCEKNLKEGYEYTKKGCELGDAYGCLHAGVVATSDQTVGEKDRMAQITKGMEMLKDSCWKHEMEKGCYWLSGLYIQGIKGYLEPNLLEAYKVSLKACEGGNPYACANVSQMHARGEGVEKNPTLAEAFKSRALALHRELTENQRPIQFGQGIDG
ncbi:cytochrome c oxidase assembly factor 7 homolog [Venturia canescens]|uniref:cytochrome c oxidase assembly factor 7 homolog n=1 Tax=Venturia canescens TaxID=32260 RepID=UPI001C9C7283|nr:cytochrome c oxidase assembly factor 7 homolog [Venturia canescens]